MTKQSAPVGAAGGTPGSAPTGGPGGIADFFSTKWGQGAIAALGVSSSYQAGDPITGAISGYGLGALAGLGPVGAVVGFVAGMVGKKKKKAATTQTPPAAYGQIWTPEDVMWSVPPLYDSLGYMGFARGPYGAGWGEGAQAMSPYGFSPAGQLPSRMASENVAGWGVGVGMGMPGSQVGGPVIGVMNVNLQGTGYVEQDARRLSHAVQWELARSIQRETASGRRVKSVS